MNDSTNEWVRGYQAPSPTDWDVLVSFEPEGMPELLMEDLREVLDDLGPNGIFERYGMVLADLRRLGDSPAEAALAALRELTELGYCPDLVMGGKPGAGSPQFVVQTVPVLVEG